MKIFELSKDYAKRNCIEFIESIPVNESHPIVVKIGEKKRSLDQNAALWKLLEYFSTQVQWPINGKICYLSEEDWKGVLSAAFRNETGRIAQGLNGGMVFLGARTSKMTKSEFSEFLDFVQAEGAKLGITFDNF